MSSIKNKDSFSANLKSLFNDVASAPYNEDSSKERMDYEKHQHDIAHSKQNMQERKLYAHQIFTFTCLWCLGLFIILIGCGMGKLKISTTIITAFIGSTTINVFVFFKLVTEYLFNKDRPHD